MLAPLTLPVSRPADADRAAIVLAGGGARAAYEVGVLDYLFHEVAAAIGRTPPVDVLCGTSAGAINASVLAAHADDPAFATGLLIRRWRALSIERVLMLDLWRIVRLFTSLILRPGRGAGRNGIGAVLDARPIAALLGEVPFERIPGHLAAGRLSAFGVTATQIATGKSVLFLERRAGVVLDRIESGREVRELPVRKEHALASAAIPMLFPPVQVEGELYCDGGLRPDLPLSTATALGARRLLVVSPHSSTSNPVPPGLRLAREQVASDPMYVAGKAIDALMNDHGDEDLERMRRCDSCGPMASLCIRPSRRIGVLAAELVASSGFRSRASGLAGTALRALTDSLPEADIVSYLLFDGVFAGRLIELGRSDARANHDELCELFASDAARAAAGD
jgi:NTE family protein